MIRAYDKSYLATAQKNLARMLDYLVNNLHYPLETAWQWFVTSELSARFEQGDCSVLVGLSGVELARAVLEQAGEVVTYAETLVCLRPQPGILDRLGPCLLPVVHWSAFCGD